MKVVRVCAVGDVHGGRYFNLFLASLRSLISMKPDIIVFAGDMVDDGKVKDLRMILDAISSKFPNTPIISIFGNEEYHEVEREFINEYPEVMWLNDSPAVLYVNDVKVGVVGTRGVLEKLTYWQRRNKPVLEHVYRERPGIIRKLLSEVKKSADVSILVSHYAPTFATIRGEPEKVYPFMGSREMEKVLKEVKPDAAIHAHAHNSRVVEAVVDGVKVYNVSLPARRGITLVSLQPRKGIVDFLQGR